MRKREAIDASCSFPDTAVLEYSGQTLRMTRAVSASGVRYSDGQLEWWTRGSGPNAEATLFRHEPDGTTGDIVKRCRQTP
jgi:membrane-bound inhibitor of C-type lysozyme